MTEAEIQNQILRALPMDLCRAWRANTGVAAHGKRVVAYGLKGQADISGILNDGRRLEIEVKSATGRQSPEQRAFQGMIEAHHGIYILARSVADAIDGIHRAVRHRPQREGQDPEASRG